MAKTVPSKAEGETPQPPSSDRGSSPAARRWFLWGVVLRTALSVIAVPLAAGLYRDHVAVLVLLRPTKEVLLFAGFKVRRGDLDATVAALAALPILLPGVWVTFGLGRAYVGALARPDGGDLPRLVGRLVPAKKVQAMQALLEDRGMWVVLLARLAVFPSSVMAAAAGAAGISWRRFLVADGAGALLSLGALLGAGYVLGDTYEDAGPWVTAGGVAAVAGLALLLGLGLRRPRHRGVKVATSG